MNVKDKRAEMSMIEAFVAISVIIIIVMILIEQDSSNNDEIPEIVYSAEIGVLRSLQINETYRADVLSSTTPVYWTGDSFPSRIKDEIERRTPSYLNCTAKICEINQPCPLEETVEKDIYVQSAFISANITTYSPKELKLFCWEK